MAHWLFKSEPFKYSWDRLRTDKRTSWDGVRNHLAKKNLQTMKRGDTGFFYHSNEGLAIMGIVEVVREAYPDPTDDSGKFVMVDIAPVESLAHPVTLAAIKADSRLKDMALVRLGRLSVQPVTDSEWKLVLALAKGKA